MAGTGAGVRRYLDRWARELIRRGIRSGLIEGSNVWLSIGAITWLLRFLARKPSPMVSVEQLRLGESIVVSHVAAPARSRRAKRRAARRQAKLEKRRAREQAKREASRRYARALKKAARQEAEQEAKRAQARPKRGRRPGPGDQSAGRRPEGAREEPG
jgi:hypothetical protein